MTTDCDFDFAKSMARKWNHSECLQCGFKPFPGAIIKFWAQVVLKEAKAPRKSLLHVCIQLYVIIPMG